MRENIMGNYFDDFSVGQVIQHALSKTIFESDNSLFCSITMNHHPAHINTDYAATTEHSQILVVGTLVLSIAVGISVMDVSGKAIANLEYNNVRHVAPVFIDDTIYAHTEILSKRLSKNKGDRGILNVQTAAYNQHGAQVLQFERTILVSRRPEEF